ncbi:chemotaxis protein CheW [Rhodobacterales bacterium HKCCE2091]|nr:chemotaxis protein CheW [Rhodobacterales bacterium HKCCE2091]
MNRPAHWDECDSIEFVSFMAGGQSFCIEITQIREIRRWTPVTALPHADKAVLGVINLRGMVIPIVDLAEQLGLGTSEASMRHVVIVVAIGTQTVGLLVDSVSEILAVPVDTICEAPPMSKGVDSDCIIGLVSVEEDMSRVLALDAVLPRALEEVA